MIPIPEFPGYYATEDGHIFSAKSGKFLNARSGKNGYLKVNLQQDGKKVTVDVHRLVASAWLGPAEGQHVLHGPNGNTDNSVENLRYGTREENTADRYEFGVTPRDAATDGWEEGYVPLLSANDVREIAGYVADGVPDQKIAHWYCIPVWSVQPVSRDEPGSYRLLVMTESDLLEAEGESAVA
jgi:hypothetical protein